MLKLNHVRCLVKTNVPAKDHVLVKVARVEKAGRKPDLLDVRVDVVFALRDSLTSRHRLPNALKQDEQVGKWD
jgi:hypothetical protein